MTKVTILGEEPQKKELKKIEFVRCLYNTCDEVKKCCVVEPNKYKNIELIVKKHEDNHTLDIMLAYDKDRDNGILYFGHFNDGVV